MHTAVGPTHTTLCHHSIKPLVKKKDDAFFLGLMSRGGAHSTFESPWASSLVVIPKKDGSVRITTTPSSTSMDTPLPLMDGILDSLNKTKMFSIFDLSPAFHQLIADPEIVSVTAVFLFRQSRQQGRV